MPAASATSDNPDYTFIYENHNENENYDLPISLFTKITPNLVNRLTKFSINLVN
jgi:hypothetical protein